MSAEALSPKPVGKAAVMAALVETAIDVLTDHGTHMPVREIAARAGVNHGLIHSYFGSKRGLMTAALDEINRRAAADTDPDGFPPPDLALRRGGQLARAIARIRLDEDIDLSTSHPVAAKWRDALHKTRPDLDDGTIDTMVVTASAVALGWAVFRNHLCDAVQLDDAKRADLDDHISRLIADLGGIPG